MPALASSSLVVAERVRETDRLLIYDANTGRYYGGTPNLVAGAVNARHYGATGNGLTDDTQAILNAYAIALTIGKALRIPAGTYLMTRAFPSLAAGVSIFGDGTATTILWRESLVLFTIAVDNVTLANFRIYKDSVAVGSGNKAATLSACSNVRLLNLTIQGITGIGVTVSGITNQKSNLIQGCSFYSNVLGLSCSTSGEYVSVSNCTFELNTTAISDLGGNCHFLNCRIDTNVDGFVLVGGGNDGHGLMMGCSLNHNTGNAISASNVVLGFRFMGCMIYDAAMSFTSCDRFIFSGCDISNSGAKRIVVNTCTRFVFDDLSETTSVQWTVDALGQVLVRNLGTAGRTIWVDPFAPTTSVVSIPVALISAAFTNDITAAAGGVPIGGQYHTAGALKIRLA